MTLAPPSHAAPPPAAPFPAGPPPLPPLPGPAGGAGGWEPDVPASAVLSESVVLRLAGPLPLDRVRGDDEPAAGESAAAVRRGLAVVRAGALSAGGGRRLAGSWSLLGAQQAVSQAEPAVVGFAVTQLAAGRWWAGGLIAATVAAQGALAVARTKYDTRTFSRMHARLAAGALARQGAAGGGATGEGDAGRAAVSRTAARVGLVGKVTDFLEKVLPKAAEGLAGVVGGTAMLSYYDPRLLPVCVGLGAAGAAYNLALSGRTAELSRGMNDQAERELAAITAGTPRAAGEHYGRVAAWRSRIGSVEAAAGAGTRTVQVALLVTALLLCGGPGAAVGTTYAVVRYSEKFGRGLGELPALSRRVVTLRDVLRRLGN